MKKLEDVHCDEGLRARVREETDLHLSPRMSTIILGIRDKEVEDLLAQVEELRAMNANELIARGLSRETVPSFEIAGRMAKKGWTSVEYDPYAPRWRVRFEAGGSSYEGPKPLDEVRAIFADEEAPT